jgi:hypothetical protein
MNKVLIAVPPREAAAPVVARSMAAQQPTMTTGTQEWPSYDRRDPWASQRTSGPGSLSPRRPFANPAAAPEPLPAPRDSKSLPAQLVPGLASVRIEQRAPSRMPSRAQSGFDIGAIRPRETLDVSPRAAAVAGADLRGGDVHVQRTESRQEGDGGCKPAEGTTSCDAYEENAWWLPSAYVHNATCACQETPKEPKSNCIRKFLQDRMVATPKPIKDRAATMKSLDNTLTYPPYQVYVQTELTPRIYLDHVDAYRSCCCPSGPAPYPAWMGVTSVPLSCEAVKKSIMLFGSCHGTPGEW